MRTLRAIWRLSILALAVPAAPAWAADTPQTLSVTPAIFEQILTPGTTTQHEVVLTNLTAQPLAIQAHAGGFELKEQLDSRYRDLYDSSSWFSIAQPQFTIEPGARHTATFTITVPPRAEPGGHYGTVFFESLVPAGDGQRSQISAAPRVGMLTFLTVKGDIREQAAIGRFELPRLLESGPVPVDLSLKNSGNVHLLPTGRVRIFDGAGHPLTDLAWPPGFTMPGTTRIYHVSWTGAQAFHSYLVQGDVTYGTSRGRLTTGRVRVWIIPWKALLVLVFLVVPLAVAGYRSRGRAARAWRAFRSSGS
jgi:hypothetical protein